MIGSYRIIRLLGTGGMGSVYEAVHDAIQRRVALKVLHPQYARSPELVKRFLNEARAANLVPHPAMVQVSECGLSEDGTVFLVMEYLLGENLAQRLRRRGGKLHENVSISIAWQLATALAAAHERAIVHRDLKPGNVMLVKDEAMPAGERVKLLDFGIAKLGQQLAAADGVHTKTGVVMGTPLYMAPEQCMGAAQVDGKADVYSLGVMVFEMLTGETPFSAAADLALLNMHLSTPPPSLQKRAPRVSKSVTKLVQQMLSKSPGDRPAMKEVARILHGQAAVALREPAPTPESLEPDDTTLMPRTPTTLRGSTGQLTVSQSRLSQIALLASAGIAVVVLGSSRLKLWPRHIRTVEATPKSPPSGQSEPAVSSTTHPSATAASNPSPLTTPAITPPTPPPTPPQPMTAIPDKAPQIQIRKKQSLETLAKRKKLERKTNAQRKKIDVKGNAIGEISRIID